MQAGKRVRLDREAREDVVPEQKNEMEKRVLGYCLEQAARRGSRDHLQSALTDQKQQFPLPTSSDVQEALILAYLSYEFSPASMASRCTMPISLAMPSNAA